MCLIALSTTRFEEIPDDFWRQACAHNLHGFGVMYCDGEGLRIRSHMAYGSHTVQTEIAALPRGVKAAIHLRNATFGARDAINAQPQVLALSGSKPLTLAVMHNGCMPWMRAHASDGPSDTALLVHEWLGYQLQGSPSRWSSEAFQQKLTRFVGPKNRLVLLDSAGTWRRIGAEQGYCVGGTWISNIKSKAWLPAAPERQATLFRCSPVSPPKRGYEPLATALDTLGSLSET